MNRVSARRSTSSYQTASVVLVGLLCGGVATVIGLWAAGVDFPFLKQGPDTRGKVPVPTNPRPIPAYTKITRDDLLVPETGQPRYMYLPPADVKQLGLIIDFSKIVGRVIDHDKPAFFPFLETDFLPTGTRPGIVAAIPPGKRAITVEVTKIQGIHALKAGDRLDILASMAIDMQKVLQHGSAAPGTAGVQSGILAQLKQARVRVLVQNGALISPVHTRVVPLTAPSLTQGSVTRTKPIQEAIIAVDPEEIAPLTEAIAIEANITCVARSGLPDDPGLTSITPSGVDPSENVAVIERIVGGRREVFFVPKAPKPEGDTKRFVAVPVCGKRIPARAKVTRDHLTDLATGRLHQISLRPADVQRLGILTDLGKIIGRVVSREKLADSAFTEEDFVADGQSIQTATEAPPSDRGISPLQQHVTWSNMRTRAGRGPGTSLSPRSLP
jgi:Flp pilus assembly protein CpaB